MDSTLNPIIISKLEAICQAIVLRLQTIGENIKSIDDRTKGELLSMYPEIPWHHYIGLMSFRCTKRNCNANKV